MQKSAIVRVRKFKPSDSEFVSSLTTRFSEFELPIWRITNEIDNKNRIALQKAMEEPEPESANFIAEDDVHVLADFIHLQTQTDYFGGDKHGYISDLAVDKRFERQRIGRILLVAAEDWARASGYHLLTLYVFAGNTRARRVYENMASVKKL